jgi:hypothetical protein
MAKRKTKTDKLEETLDQEITQTVAATDPQSDGNDVAPSTQTAGSADTQAEASLNAGSTEGPQAITFFGRDFLEARFPESLKVIDDIATDWRAQGEFAQLPIPNPTAKALVQEGLVRARKLAKQARGLEQDLQGLRSEARKAFDGKVAPTAQRVLGNVKGLYSNFSRRP